MDGWTDVICCWNSVSCFLSSTSKSFRTMLLKSDMMCRNVQIISVVTQKFYGSCSFPLNKICCSMVINPCLFYKKVLIECDTLLRFDVVNVRCSNCYPNKMTNLLIF